MLEINSANEARVRRPDRLTFRMVSRSKESAGRARRDPEPSHSLTLKPKLNPRWYLHLTAVTNCLSLRLPCRLSLKLALFPFRRLLPAVFDSSIQPGVGYVLQAWAFLERIDSTLSTTRRVVVDIACFEKT
jgi:hypothetical protein